MYVNPFWFGFLAGIVATILWLITITKIQRGGK